MSERIGSPTSEGKRALSATLLGIALGLFVALFARRGTRRGDGPRDP